MTGSTIRRTDWVVAGAFALLVLPLPFILTRYGFDWVDSFYHYLAYEGGRRNRDPMVFLYPHLGRAWAAIAGTGLLSYRLLDAALLALMHILPPLVVCGAGAGIRGWVACASAGLIPAACIAFNILGYDSFTYFLLSCVFASAWRFLSAGAWPWAALLGALTGVLTAIRFPSITVAVPVVLLILSMPLARAATRRASLLSLLAFLAASVAVYTALFHAVFMRDIGAVGTGLFSDIREQLAAGIRGQVAANASYSMAATLLAYLRDAYQAAIVAMGIFVILWVWVFFRSRVGRPALLDAAILALFALWLVLYPSSGKGMQWPFHIFLIAAGSLLASAVCVLAWRRRRWRWVQLSLFGCCMAFVPAAGSNTGLVKMALVLTFIIPVLLHAALRMLNAPAARLLVWMASLSIAFMLVHKSLIGEAFFDGRLRETVAEVGHPAMSGIQTTPQRKGAIEALLSDVRRCRAGDVSLPVLYYGTCSWLFKYLDKGQLEYPSGFAMNYHTPAEAGQLERFLSQTSVRPLVVLVIDYPEKVRRLDGRLVSATLRRMGYTLAASGGYYLIYAPGNEERLALR